MKVLYIALLSVAIIFSFSAQISAQPTPTANDDCLDDCLKRGSLIFAASNLRNFWKIVLHFEEFCNVKKELLKCIQLCSNKEGEVSVEKTSISDYICKDKLEEFRLVKECMERQIDIDSINKCSNKCGYPSDFPIQLDSSSSAPVNPLTLTDSTVQVCGALECTMICSVKESNNACAGSGYLFRDIGFKQVLEASDQFHNDAFNSTSSEEQQLAKGYLQALPLQCTYLISPINYNTTFIDNEGNNEFRTKISGIPDTERSTMKPINIQNEETVVMITKNNDGTTTPFTDSNLTTEPTEISTDNETKNLTSSHEEGGEAISISSSKEGQDDEEGRTSVTNSEEGENLGEEATNLQNLDTSTVPQEIAEHPIAVVSSDQGNENDNSIVPGRTEQTNATKQGTRERITLLSLLILPIVLYISDQ